MHKSFLAFRANVIKSYVLNIFGVKGIKNILERQKLMINVQFNSYITPQVKLMSHPHASVG